MNIIFVYKKDGVVKCLTTEESKNNHDKLIANGWKHVLTINPCAFIEYVHNDLKLDIKL